MKNAWLLLLLVSCDPPAPPVAAAPQIQLPAEVREEVARLKAEQRELAGKVQGLNAELATLENRKRDATADKFRYMLKLQLKQSHFSLDLGDHVKDSMNKAEFWIAVDKEMYDSVSNGSEILDKFRVGSLIMSGSFGSWHVKVLEKKMVEK